MWIREIDCRSGSTKIIDCELFFSLILMISFNLLRSHFLTVLVPKNFIFESSGLKILKKISIQLCGCGSGSSSLIECGSNRIRIHIPDSQHNPDRGCGKKGSDYLYNLSIQDSLNSKILYFSIMNHIKLNAI